MAVDPKTDSNSKKVEIENNCLEYEQQVSNDQELEQSEPKSCPQNHNGPN